MTHEMHGTPNKHAGHVPEMFLKKFWVSFLLSLPVILYSGLLKELFDFEPPGFPGSRYVPLVLGSIVFFYGGLVFLKGAISELKSRLPGMMTLIALAISVAYLYSLFATFTGRENLFWELTTLIAVMLLGHWLEMRSVRGARGALQELSKLLPDEAEIILENSKTKKIFLSELKEGDLVLVRPGGRIPADGTVIEGRSEVNESMITGEAKPVLKNSKGSLAAARQVIAGTINGDGSLTIRVDKIGKETFLAGIMRLVEEAQASRSSVQILADRAAFYLTMIAIISGAATFLAWTFFQPGGGRGLGFAFERLVAVLVIACPHALGLAVPLVASISTSLAARRGFLIRERLSLETSRKVSRVLFDKTGTLTKGEYEVAKIIQKSIRQPADKNQKELLQYAASVEKFSEHFVAKAITAEAAKQNLEFLAVEDFERLPGKGVRAKIGGNKVEVLGAKTGEGIYTKVEVFLDGEILGEILLSDAIREESREAVAGLKKMGIKVAMITGDSQEVAAWVSKELGIDEYYARVFPEEKAKIVEKLKSENVVAMVGDGINDAPALVQADVGIAVGAGTNIAIESAGIILVRNDPRDIPALIKLSRASWRKMIQNLFWAAGYNIVALPLAAGVLASQGILLEPALSAVFMSLSTVIVALNAMLLKNKVI